MGRGEENRSFWEARSVEKRKCDPCFGVNNVTCPHLQAAAPCHPNCPVGPLKLLGWHKHLLTARELRCVVFTDAQSSPVSEASSSWPSLRVAAGSKQGSSAPSWKAQKQDYSLSFSHREAKTNPYVLQKVTILFKHFVTGVRLE